MARNKAEKTNDGADEPMSVEDRLDRIEEILAAFLVGGRQAAKQVAGR